MPGREMLTSWLKDAHAMERALVPVLEDHAKRASEHPELQKRLTEHVMETHRHKELVEGALKRLGSGTSGGKDLIARITGAFQPTMSAMSEDTLVKNALNDYATENFEIACYKALVKAAEHLGEVEIAETCAEILEEEKKMAKFLDEHLDAVVTAAV